MVRVQCIVGEGRSQARTWKAVQVVEAGLQLVEVQALHSDDSLQCDVMAVFQFHCRNALALSAASASLGKRPSRT